MTPKRSRAYGRVIRSLASTTAAERMTRRQQDTLREAADTLVLAPSLNRDTRNALTTAQAVLLSVRLSDIEPWIEQLADDLEDAGPVPAAGLTAKPEREHAPGRPVQAEGPPSR